jgi:hypothetical protein
MNGSQRENNCGRIIGERQDRSQMVGNPELACRPETGSRKLALVCCRSLSSYLPSLAFRREKAFW